MFFPNYMHTFETELPLLSLVIKKHFLKISMFTASKNSFYNINNCNLIHDLLKNFAEHCTPCRPTGYVHLKKGHLFNLCQWAIHM